jgi:excisionase family DNA binding protein
MRNEVPVGLLTVPEVASFLRLGKTTVYQMIRNGELRSVRFGQAVRVPREALELVIKNAMPTA